MRSVRKRARETNLSRIFIARILFHINFALWLAMGVFYIYKMVEDGNRWTAAMVAFFFTTAASSLLFAARNLNRRGARAYFIVVLVPAFNIFLAAFGFPDFFFIIAALLDIVVFVNLIPLKDHYAA
jgi:hypothetical protein